ncbi:MAG: hypothetical protein K8T89_20865 [Planctomycetes bacterium]|nr:hypothetical protein [Planctomycetota bacterium]
MKWIRTDGSFFQPDRSPVCPLFDSEVPVLIHTGEQEIEPNQLQALNRFLEIPSSERAGLKAKLFADYLEVFDAVGEGPEIISPEQVWKFVQWTTVLIPLQGLSGSRFVFVKGDPAWELEHGVELLFRDEKLIRLDRQSGAFLSTCFWDWY